MRPSIRPCNKGKAVLVVKRRKRKQPTHTSKPGIPNLTKDVTEPPISPGADDQKEDDDLFLFGGPLEDAVPCDTLLAFQSLAQRPDTCLTVPLLASMESVPCVLESQLYSVLQQSNRQDDSETLAMVARELEELWHKNILRRLTSVQQQQQANNLSVLILTEDYRRGVWDAHDASENTDNVNRLYVQWFLDHLHCWTGRVLIPDQLQDTWNRDPPRNTECYSTIVSLAKTLEYLQRLQVIMPNHSHRNNLTTYQLWLPEWGNVLTALQTAEKRFIQKLHMTYQKELSEKSFLQQPFFNKISSKLLLQWMRDQGKVQLIPKPFGYFVKLLENKKKRKR